MNNSQKTVYFIAIIAIFFLFGVMFYSNRFYTGIQLKNSAQVAFNVDDAHGVSIKSSSKLISFESGIGYELEVSDFPKPANNVVTIAIPIKHLKPKTVYSSTLSYNAVIENSQEYSVSSNEKVKPNQGRIASDIEFKPITINSGELGTVVEFEFETNEEGVGNLLLNFKIDDPNKPFNLTLSKMRIYNFKEQNDGNNVDEQQSSQTTIEVK